MRKKFVYFFLTFALLASVCFYAFAQSKRANYKPKDGYVPDEQTAIAIAVAVWSPIYGKEKIEGQKPYKAALKNGVWEVRGSLPEGYDGGTAVAEISKNDGRILRVIHEQ
jgi:hypothetical protein